MKDRLEAKEKIKLRLAHYLMSLEYPTPSQLVILACFLKESKYVRTALSWYLS